ncbi:MAG TPA: hypothetical protein VGE97_06590 [Nitrososphaera sp.]|jgi:hypothetical protein
MRSQYWSTPEGYEPLAYCAECGCDFSGDFMFDRHRRGNHDYTLSEGLKFDPPKEDGRRCLTRDEMREKGWRPLTDEELNNTNRGRRRAGFGIEIWFDPARKEKTLAWKESQTTKDA